MKLKTISRASAVVIQHLRDHNGQRQENGLRVNVSALAKENGFGRLVIGGAIMKLEKLGLITIHASKTGHHGGIWLTLNEDATSAYESTCQTSIVQALKKPQEKRQRGLFKEARKTIMEISNRDLTDKSLRSVIDELCTKVSSLIDLFEITEDTLRERVNGNEKLAGIARELEASKENLTNATTTNEDEIKEKTNYDELPNIPAIDFTKFLGEPARTLKQIAILLKQANQLRNEFVTLYRKNSAATIVREKLEILVNELQVETVDPTAAMADWQKAGESVVGRAVHSATAVVSTRT